MDKRNLSSFRFLLYAFLFLLVVMFVLPFFSVPSYSIVKNTTSHLGAQGAPHAWLMNTAFILLGLSCLIEAWLHLKTFWFQKVVLSIFGVSLAFTGIFQHAPIINGLVYSPIEDSMHSIFASIVGFSFILFEFSTVFIEQNPKRRLVALAVGLVVTMLSLLMLWLPDYSGIWQRAIFIISFTWLFSYLRRAGTPQSN